MLLNKLSYNTWNIGFIEKSIKDIILSRDNQVEVHWVKHKYKDRFFADPFILTYDCNEIKVLVEDFPYYDKRGVISLLIIDRKTYELKEKKVVLKQPFHMSYPFIMRKDDNVLWVAPEASQSGSLYRYTFDLEKFQLVNQEMLLNEPVLDSTIVENEGIFWLFCTKRGFNSNSELFIYYAEVPEGPWKSHSKNPIVHDASMARPAGNIVKIGDSLYRFIQKCDKTYGEAVNLTKIDKLSATDFHETFIKQLYPQKDNYSTGFHTINGLDDLCVVDGLKQEFAPFRRFWYELRNKIHF